MEKANSNFSLFVYISFILGVIIAVLGIIFIRPVSVFLGATDSMVDDCVKYGRIILIALPFFVLQLEFQSFFVTAEKPQLGLYVTIASGVTNMILDFVLVGLFRFGLAGAAVATGLSQIVGGTVPICYFSMKNSSLLKLGKTSFDGRAVIKAATNGSSELMSNISMSLVSMLYNVQLIRYAGENGVAAYGVLMYMNFVFLSMFIGYSIGTAPIIGYHYGAKNKKELAGILKKSIVIISVSSVAMLVMGFVLAFPLSKIFVGYDEVLFDMTKRGFYIFAFSFLFAGLAIFSSGFFTALNDGLTSAMISFLRTLVFQIAAILLLPLVWGLDGIWASIVIAELMAALIGVMFIKLKKNKYGY